MSETDFRTNDARDAGDVDEDAIRRADELTVDPQVAEAYQEATERGANAKGEGRIP